MAKKFLSILSAAVWISISEFFRNEILLKKYWIEHYRNLGLVFPSEPVNGVVWLIWSLLFAILVYIISRKFSLIQTVFISWFTGFVLMWVVVGNLGVLPWGLLYAAVPLSIFESFIAGLIIFKLSVENGK